MLIRQKQTIIECGSVQFVKPQNLDAWTHGLAFVVTRKIPRALQLEISLKYYYVNEMDIRRMKYSIDQNSQDTKFNSYEIFEYLRTKYL